MSRALSASTIKISAEVQMRSLKPTVVSARNGVNLATLQLKVLMGMEAEVNVAVDGNLKDYEMSMFTRQAMPRPNNLINNSTLKQLELNALQLKQKSETAIYQFYAYTVCQLSVHVHFYE